MTGGVIDAWVALAPSVPVFFSVHGTGSAEARAMLRERLGVTPFETMDEAVAAAVAASRVAGPGSEGDAGRSAEGDSGRGMGGDADQDVSGDPDQGMGSDSGQGMDANAGRNTGSAP